MKELLELFEFTTNEFQSNEVSISRVYPQINSLMIMLTWNIKQYIYTQDLRNDFCKGLSERFGYIIENETYTHSSFLDPYFNISIFSPPDRAKIILQIKAHIRAQKDFSKTKEINSKKYDIIFII